MKEKIATVFGGSGYSPGTEQYRDGVRLGTFLAERGYLVKCGGYYGLMEAIAQGVRHAGGHILGVTNASFDPKVALHRNRRSVPPTCSRGAGSLITTRNTA